MLKRTHDFYEDITQNPQYADSRILISTHGGAGRALMHNIWKDKDFWHGCVPPNCSVTIVKLHNNVVTYVKADCIFYGEESLRNYYKF